MVKNDSFIRGSAIYIWHKEGLNFFLSKEGLKFWMTTILYECLVVYTNVSLE